MLDGLGVRLVAEALETLYQSVKDSSYRKRNCVVKSKETQKNWPRYMAKWATKGLITRRRKPENITSRITIEYDRIGISRQSNSETCIDFFSKGVNTIIKI